MDIATSGVAEGRPLSDRLLPLQRYTSRWRFVACVQTIDFTAFFLLSVVWIGLLWRDFPGYWWRAHLGVALLAAAMIHCVFAAFKAYDFTALTRGPESALRATAAGCLSLNPFLAPLMIMQTVGNGALASGTILVAAGFAGIAISRFGIARLAIHLQRWGLIDRKIYIIADSNVLGTSLKQTLERSPNNRVIGMWNLSQTNDKIEVALDGALDFLRSNPVDIVILKLPVAQHDRLVSAAHILRRLPRTVLFSPSFGTDEDIALYRDRSGPDGFGNIALVKLSERPLAGWRWVIKDVQDRTLAFILLAFVAPSAIAIAVLIKISDPGPVFFCQERRGYGGNTFQIIKFRTMKISPTPEDQAGFKLTTRNDPRVFPVGALLRRISFDELPQLINVLKGDMWLIGPRPHPLLAQAGGVVYPDAVQDYAARYRIKPGITGWAQVCGWRGPTDTLEQLSKRVEHDLYYIENWSTLFDLMILFKTLSCAFGHKNAF